MISSTMQNTSVWMMPFCGGMKVFGEGSKHCFMTPTGLPMCRCTFAKKRNYELCYSLLLAVNEEQLHIATRLRYYFSLFDQIKKLHSDLFNHNSTGL